MGFEVRSGYHLEFTGHMAGVEVHIRSTSIGTTMKLRREIAYADLVNELSSHLVSWNLELNGEPIGTSAEEILAKVEEPYVIAVFREWLKAASGVTAPLDEPSESGDEDKNDEETSMPFSEIPMTTNPE